MDQTVITLICGLVLAAAIAGSYVRYKKNGIQDEAPTPTVKETMREVSEYFGVNTQSQSNLSNALDLAPMQMASAITNQANSTQTKKSKKRRR